MAEHLGVRRDELVSHAGRVESVAAQVNTAAQAGAATRADNAAYGKLCTMVPVLLNVLQDILVDGIESAAESLRDTGARLRDTAADYEAADSRSVSALRATRPGP